MPVWWRTLRAEKIGRQLQFVLRSRGVAYFMTSPLIKSDSLFAAGNVTAYETGSTKKFLLISTQAKER